MRYEVQAALQILPLVVLLAFFLLPLFLLALPRERRWVKILALLASVGSIGLIVLAFLVANDQVRLPDDFEEAAIVLLFLPPLYVCYLIIALPLYFVKLPPNKWWGKLVAAGIGLASLVALCLVALFTDDWLPVYHSPLFCAFFIALAVIVQTPLIVRFRSKIAVVPLVLFCLAVLIWHFSDYTDIRTFKRFYAGVQNGMTEPEVTAVVQKEFGQSSLAVPDFYRDKNNNAHIEYLFPHAPNGKSFSGGYSAFVYIYFKEGRVENKRYSND